MRFAKNTQRDTSKVLRLPRKMTMDTPKVLRLPRKLQHIFWKRRKSIAPATQNDFRRVAEHVWMSRSATPATRNEATTRLKPPKRTTSAELPIGTAIRSSHERLRTVANGCERLRTVALANATSSEHTLNPQTPRVKREPLLRIREKSWQSSERSLFTCQNAKSQCQLSMSTKFFPRHMLEIILKFIPYIDISILAMLDFAPGSWHRHPALPASNCWARSIGQIPNGNTSLLEDLNPIGCGLARGAPQGNRSRPRIFGTTGVGFLCKCRSLMPAVSRLSLVVLSESPTYMVNLSKCQFHPYHSPKKNNNPLSSTITVVLSP